MSSAIIRPRFLIAFLVILTLAVSSAVRWRSEANAKNRAMFAGVTATETAALITDIDNDTKADPGDTIEYTVTVNNGSGAPITGVQLNSTLDSKETLVATSTNIGPVAAPDAYNTIGNVNISIPTGAGSLLSNDSDPDVSGPLTITKFGKDLASAGGTNPGTPITTTNGGTLTVNADGSFAYDPAAGITIAEDFYYTVSDGGASTIGKATVTIAGRIWFIKNGAGACASSCDGRMSHPFATTGAFQTVNTGGVAPNPQDNDFIFIFGNTETTYNGSITTRNNQKFIGQAASATILSITAFTTPSGTSLMPGTVPTAQAPLLGTTSGNGFTINPGVSTTLRGFNIGDVAGLYKITSGASFGTLTTSEMALSGAGGAINLSAGTCSCTFSSINTTSGVGAGIHLATISGTFTSTGGTTIASTTGSAIFVSDTSTVASNFGNTSITGGSSSEVVLLNSPSATTNFGTLSIDGANSSSAGVFSDAGGSITVTGTTSITNTGSTCLEVHNSSSPASFQRVDALSCAGPGVVVQSNSSNTSFTELNVSPDIGSPAISASNNTGTISSTTGVLTVTGNAGAFNNQLVVASSSVLSMTFSSVTSTSVGAFAPIDLATVSGSLVMTGGTITGNNSGNPAFKINGGSVNVTYKGDTSQANNNRPLVSVTGGHTGTVTFDTGTVSATNGTGLQFDNADGTYNFNGTTTLNGGDAGIDILNGSTGTFSFGAGTTITRANSVSGAAFNLSSSNAGVTYSGAMTLGTSTGNMVAIDNHDAGTITFQTGNLTKGSSTTQGIAISNSNGGTINFNNPTIGITMTSGKAVNMSSSNSGGAVNFNPAVGGNGLDLISTSADTFDATGGGTVTVTGSGNTLSSTTGTALNVANTTIGASGLTFQSISSNGAAKGIVLNTTGASGGLIVSGTGGTCSAADQSGCTGGTIQGGTTRGAEFISTAGVTLNNMYFNGNATTAVACGDDVTGSSNTTCDAAIFMSGVTSPTLNKIYINGTGSNDTGIIGNTVSAMTVGTLEIANFTNAAKTPFNFQNLTGTTGITGLNVHNNSGLHTVMVTNNTGTANLTFTSPIIQSNSGTGNPDSLQVNSYASGTALNVTATGVNITASSINTGNGVMFQANTGSSMTSVLNGGVVTGTNGILMQETGTNTTFNFTVTGLTSVATHDLGSNAITVGKANGTNATFTGNVSNNVITSATCGGGCAGIKVASFGVSGISTATVSGNDISGVDAQGIWVVGGQGSSALAVTIQGNNLHNPALTAGQNTSYAIDAYNGTQSGDAVCFATNLGDMSSSHTVPANKNTITGAWQSGGNPIEVGIFNNSVHKLLNYPSPNTNDTNAANWVKTSNGGLGTDAFHISPAGNFGAGAACSGFPPTVPQDGEIVGVQGAFLIPNEATSSSGSEVKAAHLPAVNAYGEFAFIAPWEARGETLPEEIARMTASGNVSVLKNESSEAVDTSDVLTEIASKIWEQMEPRAYAYSGETVTTTPTFTIPTGGSVTIKYRATVDNGPFLQGMDTISNSSTVTGSPSVNTTSNTATTPLDAAPDLFVSTDDSSGTIEPGVTRTYTLTYKNNNTNVHSQGASGVILTVTPPPASVSTYNFTVTPGWTCAATCTKTISGTLPANNTPATTTIAFDIKPDLAATVLSIPLPASIAETTAVHDNGTDLNIADNSNTDTDTVVGVWIGDTSTDFANNLNWSNDILPAFPQNISVPTGAGVSPRITSADITVNGLVLAKDLTIDTGRKLTVNNTLALGSNNIAAGTTPVGIVELAATTGQITNSGGGHVNVTLQKDFSAAGNMPTNDNTGSDNVSLIESPSAPTATFVFPVGFGTTYTPVTATNLTSSAGSSLAVTAINGPAPGGLSSKALQMYWQTNATGTITADMLFDYGTTVGEWAPITTPRVIHFPVTGSAQVSGTNTCPGGPCIDTAGNTIKVNGISSFDKWWTAGEASAPTAAGVTVSGRVMNQSGRGVANARVSITGMSGAPRFAVTNQLGYYRFDDIDAGQFCIVNVASSRYRFAPRQVLLNDAVSDLDFVADP